MGKKVHIPIIMGPLVTTPPELAGWLPTPEPKERSEKHKCNDCAREMWVGPSQLDVIRKSKTPPMEICMICLVRSGQVKDSTVTHADPDGQGHKYPGLAE